MLDFQGISPTEKANLIGESIHLGALGVLIASMTVVCGGVFSCPEMGWAGSESAPREAPAMDEGASRPKRHKRRIGSASSNPPLP